MTANTFVKTLEILEQLKTLSLVETAELIRQVADTFGVDATSRSRSLSGLNQI